MMIAESSSSASHPSMDEEQQIKDTNETLATTTTNAITEIPKNSKFISSASSSSQSSILSPLAVSSISSTSLSSLQQKSPQTHQEQKEDQHQQEQQQKKQQQLLPDRSKISTINVFTNFPPSCCCRQMMTTTTTATPKISSATSKLSNSCKKSLKNGCSGGSDSRLGIGGPSPLRQLLPIALCILSFATVLSILIVYMDTTEIRHQQFRLNMSRDYELYGVPQDDPTLIAFLREIHMKKYPMNFLKNAPIEHLNFTENHELTPEMANYISNLIGNGKLNGGGSVGGSFIQSLTGSTSYAMTAPWLAETLNWSGLIVEPEPRRYFSLRKQNVHRPKVQVVHACLSPSGYPKEVRIHNEDSEVRINSLLDEETSWFNSRVKCFPLYTLMLATNKVDYDLLSLGCPDNELQILETLPFNKVNIEIITIHLTENQENVTEYIRNITKFLNGKSYKLQKRFENNYIYQKINNNNKNNNYNSSKIRTKKQIKQTVAATTATATNTTTTTQTTKTITALTKTQHEK